MTATAGVPYVKLPCPICRTPTAATIFRDALGNPIRLAPAKCATCDPDGQIAIDLGTAIPA